MFERIWNGTAIPLFEKAAAFGERRHEVLAGNIANIDTPGYHMRDLPVKQFQQALAKATERYAKTGRIDVPESAGTAPAAGSTDLQELFPKELFQPKQASPVNLTFHDKNNRSIEHQVMEMTKNLLMQKFALRVLAAQFDQLQAVISERP